MGQAKRNEEERIAAMDKKELFLMAYEDLCKKHKMIIDSCGCCDGPDIITEEEMKNYNYSENFETTLNGQIDHLKGKIKCNIII